MPYAAETSRSNPGCFLFLVDQSGSMDEPFGANLTRRKADGVADAINRLLQNLVIKCTKSEGVRDYYDVGVIGYGSGGLNGFGGPLAGRALVPLSEVADNPVRIEERLRKVADGAGGILDESVRFPVWFEAVAVGPTPMCLALERAQQTLSDWTARHPDSYPPVVINITDGESTDGDPVPFARALTSIATSDGNVLLFNCHISGETARPIVFPPSLNGVHDRWARELFLMSSELPERIRLMATSEGLNVGPHSRGFAFNTDMVDLIRFLDIGTRPSNLR